MISTTTLALSFAHLSAMTDERGVFEHAEFDTARREHGYCVDDVARALIVVSREPDQTPELSELAETYLRFLENALENDGGFHNRGFPINIIQWDITTRFTEIIFFQHISCNAIHTSCMD